MSETTRPPLDLTVRATLNGWPVDVHLALPAEKVAAALDRLAALGYAPRVEALASSSPARKPARPKVEPLYTPAGAPCCPVHHRELAEGRYGLYCPSKAAPGEEANEKGYCALRFDS